RYPEGDWNPRGLAFEDAFFTADDGVKIHGWYVPHTSPRAVILYCHGNAGNISHRAELLRVLHDDVGASVLAFDYRGYGRSEGSPSESGILADARAARAWLARREGIAPGDAVLVGNSLGGAVAVDLAATDGAKGLVLESTFTSVPDMAAYHYPWLPVGWLLRTRLNSLAKIGKYHGPLLAAHGDADTIVPYEHGRKLFEAANPPKNFIPLKGLDHNDFLPGYYYDALVRFLDALKSDPAGRSSS
ncbi:MAG TPA: alpha/beta hydrolase, partial [Thermoguttaceae bacterium]|nr:alpha/beta hydrolase [Thermoguttaceae bacterium]